MAGTTQFTIEGEFIFAYFADEQDSKHVLIYDADCDRDPHCGTGCQQRLETKIANEVGLPTDPEFDGIFGSLEDMRSKGMRPEEGMPVMQRQAKLRITVEVL